MQPKCINRSTYIPLFSRAHLPGGSRRPPSRIFSKTVYFPPVLSLLPESQAIIFFFALNFIGPLDNFYFFSGSCIIQSPQSNQGGPMQAIALSTLLLKPLRKSNRPLSQSYLGWLWSQSMIHGVQYCLLGLHLVTPLLITEPLLNDHWVWLQFSKKWGSNGRVFPFSFLLLSQGLWNSLLGWLCF